MLSKLLRPCHKLRAAVLLCPRVLNRATVRVSGSLLSDHLIPASQYKQPYPAKLRLGFIIFVHWEVWPLLAMMVLTIFFVVGILIWNINNKVDLIFHTNCNDTISRTMDLRNPTIHKIVTINQEYLPWPEMANVLDKMAAAERRAISRAKSCNYP